MATMIDDPNPFDLDLDGFYERYLKTCAMWGITAVESRASRRARAGVERSPSRTARADEAIAPTTCTSPEGLARLLARYEATCCPYRDQSSVR